MSCRLSLARSRGVSFQTQFEAWAGEGCERAAHSEACLRQAGL